MAKGKRRRARLSALMSRRQDRPGTSPGMVPAHQDEGALLSWFSYDVDGLDERQPVELSVLDGPRRATSWLNIDGARDFALVRALGERLDLHPLALEDTIHTGQRPKLDTYHKHLFTTLQLIYLGPEGELITEQATFFLLDGLLITVQERPGDCLDPVRERLRAASGRIRSRGPDYLLYALMDTAIDHYFPVLEKLADRLEHLEEEILERPRRELVGQLHLTRRELLMLRRAVWPLRDVISRLMNEELPGVTPETRLFLRDCHDHVVQVLDMTETMRELCASLLESYMSSVSLRMNEIMQVLTVMSTIFIPLTFISGLYGMNFKTEVSVWNMPELSHPWGYPAVLLLMLTITVALLVYFRRMGWLGGSASLLPPDK